MEIIIHGKPNAGSSKVTSDINGLSRNLIQNFFEEMDQIRDPEALVVDARYWQGTWYSIYTYLLGVNIKDTADRKSYFALSVVVPKTYYCLISEVYKQLKAICAKSVIGNYISKNGKYLVQTLDDESLFENIVSQVKTGFVNSNLEEDFDSKFESKSILKNDVYYNIIDCDSRAFVLSLKKCGRIIVTETEKSKDELLSKTNEYIRLLNQAQTDLSDKDKHIDKLNKDIAQLEKDLSEANKSTKGKVQKLQNDLTSLSTEKEKLQKERNELNDLYNGIREKIDKVAEDLGLSKLQSSSVGNNARVKNPSQTKQSKSVGNGWYDVIPLFNTLLILLLMLILLFNIKGCYSFSELTNVSDLDLNAEIDNLKQELVQKEAEIKTLKESLGEGEYHGTSDEIDEDCQIAIWQDNRPVEATDVDLNKELTIIVGKPKNDYQFYSDNLKDASKLKASMPIKLKPQDKTKPIIISYRSAVLKSANPKNKFELK